MSRPPKPVALLESEKKSHRTKKELAQRKNAEQSLLTGQCFKEREQVRSSPVAHKEFLRLRSLLQSIGKNDAIYEGVINRYCIIHAECCDFESKREVFFADLEELSEDKQRLISEEGVSLSDYFKMKQGLQKSILDLDRQVQAKRKMMMDIERENVMTIASALRNIPKTETGAPNPLMALLDDG